MITRNRRVEEALSEAMLKRLKKMMIGAPLHSLALQKLVLLPPIPQYSKIKSVDGVTMIMMFFENNLKKVLKKLTEWCPQEEQKS